MGKMNYTYRKLTAPKDKPACVFPILSLYPSFTNIRRCVLNTRVESRCAACDITHGGLHLDETGAWKEVKAELGREGVVVEQMHRDEVGGEVSFAGSFGI